MKNTWVLSIKTSLPGVCYKTGDLNAKIYAFESFEEAKNSVRKVMRDLAFSKNSMFDGEGNLIHLSNYINDLLDEDEDDEALSEGWLNKEKLIAVQGALQNIFKGEDVIPNIKEEDCTDYMIAYCYKNGEIRFYGDDDGPCNGYDPVIRTNMFSMKEEKDYFLYIDDMFGQDEATSELYIDLCKAQSF